MGGRGSHNRGRARGLERATRTGRKKNKQEAAKPKVFRQALSGKIISTGESEVKHKGCFVIRNTGRSAAHGERAPW